MTHLLENKLPTNKQYGFISGRSTTIQLLTYLESCVKNIDGIVANAIYFAEAFDTVPHRRLIGKLESYGISGNLLGGIKYLLRERSHIVSVDDANSSSASVISGLSHCTSIICNLYKRYLLDNLASDGFMFADDTNIFKIIASGNDAIILQSRRLVTNMGTSSRYLSSLSTRKVVIYLRCLLVRTLFIFVVYS